MKYILLPVLMFSFISCGETKQAAAKKEDSRQSAFTETLQQKQSEGIDLYAKGSTPASWTLEMDFDRIINFRALDGADYKSTPANAVNNEVTGTTTYTTKANKGDMLITLYKENCTDLMSGQKFNKKITVKVDGKLYEGCGQYLSDANLGSKWILSKIGNRTITASEFSKGLPELVFDPDGGKLSGHDGCNRITGSIEVQGNRIQFSPLAGTKMACPGNNKDNDFIQKLSGQTASYFFRDGELTLYLIDDSTISFKKA